jgi:hypothetical protein
MVIFEAFSSEVGQEYMAREVCNLNVMEKSIGTSLIVIFVGTQRVLGDVGF